MIELSSCRRRAAGALALALAAGSVGAQQGLVAPGAPVSEACRAEVGELNAGLAKRSIEALMTAAAALETGRCVARDEGKAAEYLSEAVRRGHRPAALRLARKFGRGSGVPQSYANAGAWLAGKGMSEEGLGQWDYSVGYAYTVASALLSSVKYPPREAGQPAQIEFVISIDARQPPRVSLRSTSPPSEGVSALGAALERAFRERLPEVISWLAPPDPRLLVTAAVSVPVSLRYDAPDRASVLESEPLLR